MMISPSAFRSHDSGVSMRQNPVSNFRFCPYSRPKKDARSFPPLGRSNFTETIVFNGGHSWQEAAITPIENWLLGSMSVINE